MEQPFGYDWGMDASPLLARVVAALAGQKLEAVLIGKVTAKVASLPDIIASKKAAGRERDLAVLPVLEKTLKATASRRPRGS
jgi:hypothetical protein